MINWLHEPNEPMEDVVDKTTKEEILYRLELLSESLMGVDVGSRPNRLIGELIAHARRIPEPYKKGEKEYEAIVSPGGIDVKVFFDYLPDEPTTYDDPGCDEGIEINHCEIINNSDIEEYVWEHIAEKRDAANDEQDFYDQQRRL